MHLIITRPIEDAKTLQEKLLARGHTATVLPLLKIVPRSNVKIPRESYQLICATSANALKHGTFENTLKDLPLITVGPQSLAEAKAQGFKNCSAEGGDVHGLSDYIIKKFNPQNGPILYLSGAETSADLQSILRARNFTVNRVIIYDAVIESPAGLQAALTKAGGVALYSPRSAQLWVNLITRELLEKLAANTTYYCLSENVANKLPQNWPKRIAKTPDEAAMLALLDQTPRTS